MYCRFVRRVSGPARDLLVALLLLGHFLSFCELAGLSWGSLSGCRPRFPAGPQAECGCGEDCPPHINYENGLAARGSNTCFGVSNTTGLPGEDFSAVDVGTSSWRGEACRRFRTCARNFFPSTRCAASAVACRAAPHPPPIPIHLLLLVLLAFPIPRPRAPAPEYSCAHRPLCNSTRPHCCDNPCRPPALRRRAR